MASTNLVIFFALGLVVSAQPSLKFDFVRDVVHAGRRLEGHTGGGAAPDLAGCDKECPGFMKMLMEVGPKLMVDEKDPDYAKKMEAAITEHVCPRKDEAKCPMEKCDDGTKAMMGGLSCVCACPGIMQLDGIKTDDDIKKNCGKLRSGMKCIESKGECAAMYKMAQADPDFEKESKKMDELCPGGGSESSFASRRAVDFAASLAAIFTGKVVAEL